MPQFEISSFSSQLIWLSIIFGILYYIIAKLIAPRLESILATRNSYNDDNIAYAQECNDKIKSLENMHLEQLDQIHTQAEAMLKNSTDAFNAEFAKKQSDLSQTLEKKRENALINIQNYIDRFHDDSEQYCIKIAALIVEKVTNKETDIALLKEIYGRK